ncbi:MAG: fibronectin type III domain-containing protein, partial [Bacteroidetes bacterium]|nr:fibronectin type III domain-containing protein [Bacteroidota bacterium]
VRAINSVGSSGWSNTANATTAAATATVPTAPRSLSATADRQTIINLSWTASANTGGSPITGYRIQWSANGTSGWQNVSPAHTGTGRTYADTGLNPGTTRHYRVYARNSVGESAQPSDVANATTATTGTVTAPSAPRSLRATASGQTIINLSWSAPSSMGGASIRGYRIEVSDDGGTNWTDLVASHSETTYSHTGLTAGSTRYYRVYAINAEGLESLPSDVDSATTTTSGTTTDIVVSFVVASSQVNENVATVAVQINVNPAPTSSLTVLYSLGGTATQTTDYTTQGAGSLTVAANATSANLSIAITNDQVDESDETIIVTLTSGTGYDIGSQSVYTLTIVDDDDPDVPPLTFAETIPNQSFIVGVPIDEVVLADAVGGTPPYRFALTPDPPAGLEFDASTRSISGTPSASMPATTYTYTVTDDDNATAMQTFTIEVIAPQALVFADSVADQMLPLGKAIADLVLPSAKGGVLPYVYALTPDPPKGITFDAETRMLSGTPSEVTKSQVYTYTVEDRAGTSSKLDFEMEVYTIMFTETVPNQSYPRGQVIDPLVLPEVTGGVPPIQYTLTLFDLPFDLRFDARTRTISGTPLVITPRIALTYTATDHHGAQDSLLFSIGIISPVHADENPGIPQEFRGYSNYPNPFQSSTNLVFDLPWPARVQVEVLDITGRRLVSSPSVYLTAGWGNEIELSDLNLPSGAYLYRIQATSLDDNSSSVYVGHSMSVR